MWGEELKAALVAGGQPVYLVGGTVRDLMLGAGATDVDVAVEGDAIELARGLADRLGGDLVTHGAFGTAVVAYGDGEHVDVVTARRETYPAPAALPVVAPGTIDDDLRRRDFTVNAMARSLPDERLIDPCGGERDLGEGTIRVLHERSFVDDPTRIFRAIRYESRLGFRMDGETERLAREAIEAGLVRALTPARVREELVALLEEDEAPRSIPRMAELRLDRALDPPLRAGLNAVARIRRLRELNDELALGAPRWRLALEALLDPGTPLDGLALSGRDARLVEGTLTVGREAARRAAELTPAELVALVEPFAPDAPLFALAVSDAPALRAYFERLRDLRLELTGADILALGVPESPRVGEVLGELRRRRLNGELAEGREAELAAARELIGADE
jgi:tRNA nucleotidyltransferase (CCA-adding enzyme)